MSTLNRHAITACPPRRCRRLRKLIGRPAIYAQLTLGSAIGAMVGVAIGLAMGHGW